MTRAKDISKIITDADFSGTLDVTGTITVGDGHTIGDDADDNLEIATSVGENLVLKSSGNVLTYLDTNEDQSTAAYQIYGDVTSPRSLLRVEETGDISFYEDTGTTPKLFWDASAESLGINETSPSSTLVVGGNATTTAKPTVAITDTTSGATLSMRGQSPKIAFDVTSSGVPKILMDNAGLEFKTGTLDSEGNVDFKIASNGDVGIGTSSPDEKLDTPNIIIGGTTIAGNYRANALLVDNASGISRLFSTGSNTSTAGQFVFQGASSDGSLNTERMRIDGSGNVGIGTSSPDGTLHVYSNNNPLARFHAIDSADKIGIIMQHNRGLSGFSGKMIQFRRNDGTEVGSVVIGVSSTAYNTSSDHRLKENVTTDWDATTRLKQLNPVRFNFIADADTTVDGFLAHEVQSVVPEAITGTHNEVDADGNPVYQGIDQSKLVPLLVKTIQELEARITALETA